MKLLALRNSGFSSKLSKIVSDLRHDDLFADVLIHANLDDGDDDDESGGKSVLVGGARAHKWILAAASAKFRDILLTSSSSSSIIRLDGVRMRDVDLILDFVYKGEVEIDPDQIGTFMELGRELGIDGLTKAKTEEEEKKGAEKTTPARKALLVEGDRQFFVQEIAPPDQQDEQQKGRQTRKRRMTEEKKGGVPPKKKKKTRVSKESTNVIYLPAQYDDDEKETEGENREDDEEDTQDSSQGSSKKMMEKTNVFQIVKEQNGNGDDKQALKEFTKTNLTASGSKKGFFQCGLCAKSLSSQHAGKRHLLEQHAERDFVYFCPVCDTTCKYERRLREHWGQMHPDIRHFDPEDFKRKIQ